MELNFRNFIDIFIFCPNSQQLSEQDRKKALVTTLALGILSLGFVHTFIGICNLIRFRGRITRDIPDHVAVQATIEVSKRRFLLNHLITPKEIESLKCQEMVHELCEVDLEGNFRACSLSRLQKILDYLKENKLLTVLDTVPQYYHNQHNQQPHTPLSYWISKGNLEAVRLLIEDGAAMRVEDPKAWFYDHYSRQGFNKIDSYSALYQAMQLGKIDIVNYLLEKGAKADFAFKNNVLCYFIPTFVYELSRLIEARVTDLDASITCLERVLKSLSEDQLKTQLRIPIAQRTDQTLLNSVAWIKQPIYWYSNGQKIECSSPAKTRLIQLLEKFGAKTDEVYSMDELPSLGHVGTGLTLADKASLK